MRIRKCASKILGSDSSACNTPPPPPPFPHPPRPAAPSAASDWGSGTSVSAAAASVIVCLLNQSPWDYMAPDLDVFQENVGEGAEEEEDATKSLVLKKIKVEDEIVTPQLVAPSASEKKFMKMVVHKNCTRKEIKEEKEEKIGEKMTAAFSRKKYRSCSKNDGKGWHCKRPAECPSNLCHYHLSQLRSYSFCDGGHNNGSGAAAAATMASPETEYLGRTQHHQQKKRKRASADASDYTKDYYYYSEFGPWRSKRRGTAQDNNGRNRADNANKQEEAVEKAEETVAAQAKATPESADAHDDGPVAGEDEEDNYYDGDAGDGDGLKSKDDSSSEGKAGQKTAFVRKRGRKPVKARSLKSLL